jgi:hypothetical protein
MPGCISPDSDLEHKQPLLCCEASGAWTRQDAVRLSQAVAKKLEKILHPKEVLIVVAPRDGLVGKVWNQNASPIQDVAHSNGASVCEYLSIDIRLNLPADLIGDRRQRPVAINRPE